MGEFSRAYKNKTHIHVVDASVPGGYAADDRFEIAHGFLDIAGNPAKPDWVWVQPKTSDPYLVQTLNTTGTVSGGTFTLDYDGQVTSAIAYDASNATIKTALAALSNLVADDITMSNGPLPSSDVTITFTQANIPHPVLLICDDASITGGGTLVIDDPVALTHNDITLIEDWDATNVYLRSNETTGEFYLFCV